VHLKNIYPKRSASKKPIPLNIKYKTPARNINK